MIDAASLRAALPRWCAALEAAAPELNALDGRLGDADLGATLQKCAANVAQIVPGLGDELEATFKACAQACARASGSSFGTLLTLAFMTAMRQTAGVTAIDRAALARLIGAIVQALSARGGAALGDKTVLDALQAIHVALAGGTDEAGLKAVALGALASALDEFRGKPNRIGRARMFADKSVGLDDPGMVALQRMVESL